MKISRNGLEKMNLCGRVTAGRKERRKQEVNEAPLAAFSTIELFYPVSCALVQNLRLGDCGRVRKGKLLRRSPGFAP